jgi:hypothetical protein
MSEHLVDRIANLGHDGTRTAKPAESGPSRRLMRLPARQVGD